MTITINPLPPTAVNESYSVTENGTLTVAAPGVLSNDTDPNKLTLKAVSFTNPVQGRSRRTLMGTADSSTCRPRASTEPTVSPTRRLTPPRPPRCRPRSPSRSTRHHRAASTSACCCSIPPASGALDDTGSGSITVTNEGAVVVDSNDATAAILSGAGAVNASTIDVTGGTKVTGSGKFSSTVVHAAPIVDPLGLSLPTAPATTYAAMNYSGKMALTLSPGTYVGGIKISGSGSVVLLPGVYYMKGGGFSITGSGSVTGVGVLFINAPSKSTDSISLTGSGNLTLSPYVALTGAYTSYNGRLSCRTRRRRCRSTSAARAA